jgi:hypothetical protein
MDTDEVGTTKKDNMHEPSDSSKQETPVTGSPKNKSNSRSKTVKSPGGKRASPKARPAKSTKQQQRLAEQREREDEELRRCAQELNEIKNYKLIVEVGPHD